MRTLRDAVCLLVAVGSVALAALQPSAPSDRADAVVPTRALKQVDDRVPQQTIERAVLTAPIVKA